MKYLIYLRNRILRFTRDHNRVVGYLLKLVIVFLALTVLRANAGYNTILSNFLIIIALSVACAFIPMRFLVFVLLAYTAIQMFSLSVGIAIITVVVLLIMYLIYFRFSKDIAYVIILLPILYMIRIPLALPMLLAIVAPADALVSVVFGTIIYFMIHNVHLNATAFSDVTANELSKVSLFLEGTFTNKEFLYSLFVMIVIFLLVYFVKRISVNRSNDIAVAIGVGAYIVLMIAANLVFETITSQRIVSIVAGAVASGIIVEIIHNVVLPLDYTRTNILQFEDEEYYYYVRAVPKAMIGKESISVNRINPGIRKSDERSRT